MNPGIPEPPPLSGPPPPPPPPVPGQVPALRISTASEPGPRRSKLSAAPQDPYEPPAAIQNAMMTKDKKPFTYTPGMGGKLDLSQIRSPRMARRVAKNANDEGIEGPPKSALAQEPRSPPTAQPQQPNMYSHPQVAVPVFPQSMPQQPAVNLRNSTLPRSPPVIERVEPAPRPVMKVETKIQPVTNSAETPTPPTSPTQVTLAKAPTPWMQKQSKQQEELPEWAKRSTMNRSQDSSSSGSESPLQQQPPSLPRQIVVVHTPKQPPQTQPQQMRPMRQDSERVIVPRIEDRPSVFSALNESGHHQLANTTPHHQSRWGNPVGQSAPPPVQQTQGGAYIIPVQVDSQPQYQMPKANANHNQQQYRNVPVENQAYGNMQQGYVPPSQQVEPGPVQSKSFRILQKITDTDSDDIDGEQLRKLQLTEDDRCLMNKFKEQVDGDTYLHKEEDPRYRGSAIPSRAFRYLQNMTDSGDVANANNTTPKPVNSAVKKQNRNSKNFDTEVQVPVYVPASEQQVQEPKKYMGGAIPSRSFRLLQAMTAPESIATQVTQENRQDSATDFVSMPGNQLGVYYPVPPYPIPPTSPPAYWNPETGWWAYYPIPPPYAPYEFYPNPYFYYHPQFYSIDGNSIVDVENQMTASQYSLDNNNSRVSELNDNSRDECTIAFRGNPLSRNSALYVGSQWRYDSSTTATSCTTTSTENSDRLVEEQPLTSSSPLSSLSSEDDSESEKVEEEEDSCSSSKRNGDEEENASVESSDSSCGSDSYLAYSTGLNPLNIQENVTLQKEIEEKEVKIEDDGNDSTDCEKESLEEDDQEIDTQEDNDEEDEKISEPVEQEDLSNTTVSVSLPLRFKFSVSDKNEDVTTVIVGDSTVTREVETCVNFTLKRPCSKEKIEEKVAEEPIQVKPTFVVTTTDDDRQDESKPQETTTSTDPTIEDKRKTLLSVQSHSREEVTDDEDSGVTSDMSRIISEVDTDSECCLTTTTTATPTVTTTPTVDSNPVTKRTTNKYQRTQTHSRLFRLLKDEQLMLPSMGSSLSSHEEHSSNSSGLNSPDCTLMDHPDILRSNGRHQLPSRPKSLDCEALFKRHQDDQQQDSYYQTWKNGERSPRKSPVTAQWTYPRVNVLCPRIKSAKNVPQTLMNQQQPSRMKSPLGSTMLSSSIPSPIRTNNRC